MYEMMRAYFSDRHRMRLLQDRLAGGLSESERIFLEAAELGNLDVIKDLLESGKVKVDCCDQQGRTALEMAVTGNDVDIVTYLLERTSARHIHKALLAAADNDMDRICEMILDHPLYKETIRRESMKHAAELSGKVGNEFTQGIDNRFSHANLSKLLLEVLLRAAKRNNFQIVKKIMMCGVCLEEPHDYFCSCADCTEWRKEDFKVFTTRRLDTFTALASPAYISLSAEDPILASFYLSHKFRRLSEIEGEYKNIYDQLDQQVQNFTLALLDQCQSSGEVKAILSGEHKTRDASKESLDVDNHSNHDEEEDDEDEEIPGEETTLPLVYTAVRMEQKKFIAHPQCQAQIGEMWYSGVPFLRHLNRFAYLMLAIPIGIIVCPLLSMAYLFTPWSKVSRIVKTPLMKFLSYTCSYLTFLILITVVKLYLRHYIDTFSCEAPDTLAYIVILVVFMWISGLILEECKQVFSAGIKNYLASFWNLMDSSMLSFLLASFVLELVTPLRLHKVVEDEEAGDNFTQTGQSAGQYTICQQSKYTAHLSSADFCTEYDEQQLSAHVTWTPTWVPDPELVSDVLFSLGIICSVSRFSFIMPANEALGTMLVSFRRTVSDIIKIFGMFILVMFAFTCGLAALYAPSRCYTNSFDSFSGTLSTLTWSMFSMGDVEWPSLVEGATGPISSLTNNKDRSTGAVQVGNYLYGIYVFCTTIVLLNLLIAVMTNTFEEVQDERDVEWKFARTELWLTFIEPGNLLPPPFNIVPSPRHLWEVIVWLCQRSCSRNLLPDEAKKVRYAYVQTGSSFELNNMDEENKSNLSLESHHERKDVMCQLIRRYVRHIERLKIEGDSDKTSSEEILRRLIERMNVKVEKRLDEVQHKLLRMEREVGSVREDSSSVRQVQEEHYDKFLQFADHKTHESDRYVHFLDEAKLQILARMDSERIQMERVLDSRIHNLGRKLDDSSIHLGQQIDKLQATKGSGQSSVSPHI